MLKITANPNENVVRTTDTESGLEIVVKLQDIGAYVAQLVIAKSMSEAGLYYPDPGEQVTKQ